MRETLRVMAIVGAFVLIGAIAAGLCPYLE